MDVTKPLWELHILNVKTRDAESLFVFKIHHSIGDGASLISLLLACARKSSDPNALPSVPVKNRRARRQGVWLIWAVVRLVWNTLVDVLLVNATVLFLRDTRTPIKGPATGEGRNGKRFVHRTVSLGDIKMVKNAMNMAKWGWGNWIGNMMIPLTIALRDDPLDYLWSAKATMDRKKHSLEPILEFIGARILPMVFGVKATVGIFHKILSNTTLAFSNVVGPVEEISLYGHPIAYIAPSVYGHPHALTIHFQSYCNMMTISVAVDPEVIPDPHVLFDELEQSLIIMKGDVTLKFPKKGPNVGWKEIL
ncbi:unnamed protein product [Linum tenue]|uniref:Diacylglycerol O-acyltransferase n=1 Tax=Linum tenue TaxID=586396 RepID=A0AAV0QAB7_9ROSI|nr:unnamed protein product [Linum tenue]